ncbi:unnamed protein product [Amoebophrya sp. A120]|nr:unnamed protein product [Amoebophrya sp. A120]|eukprot:GSA120T00018964001.1
MSSSNRPAGASLRNRTLSAGRADSDAIRALDLNSDDQQNTRGFGGSTRKKQQGRRNSTGEPGFSSSRRGSKNTDQAGFLAPSSRQYEQEKLIDVEAGRISNYDEDGVGEGIDVEPNIQRIPGVNEAVFEELKEPMLNEEEQEQFRNMVLHGDLEGVRGTGRQDDEQTLRSDITSPSQAPRYAAEDYQEAITKPGKLGLEWRNLTFTVNGNKNILKNCYGKLYPGQVCALIGPSGAGKSTLMNLLAGRQGWTGNGVEMTGEVRYGGKRVDFQDLKSSIAYVMQQDAILGTQTVMETLVFAARMKLPAGIEKEQLMANVEQTLKQLDLWEHRDVPIGDALRKGISGGQKKRVSAALELLTRPSVMFLDEPTSGLDSFSSLKLIAELKNIAIEEDAIICATIHQPSSEIFDNFDRVICMRDGEIMFNGYNGKAAEILVQEEQLARGALSVGMVNAAMAGAEEQMSIYTILGFLDLIVRQPLPTGYNTADWLLYHAQSMPHDEAREVIEQCARAYELRNHGYSPERIPLIEYRDLVCNDLPIQNVMSLDKKAVFWANGSGTGGQMAGMQRQGITDDLFTLHEDKPLSNQANSSTGTTTAQKRNSYRQEPEIEVIGSFNPQKAVVPEHAEEEIHDYAEVGAVPDALKRKHLDAKWIQKHPESQELMLIAQKQNGLCFQLCFLTHRELIHRIRDPWILFFRFLIPTLQVCLFAIGFADVGRQVAEGLYDKEGTPITTAQQYGEKIRELYGAANNIIWILMFSTATGFTLTIPQERAIFLREYHSNLYGVIPYIVSKIVIEVVIILAQTAWLQMIPYLAWGMNSNFFYLWGVTFLLGMGGSAIGLFLAAANCNAPERSVMMTPIFLSSVPNVFSGAFRPVAEMPQWMAWLAYAIPSTYGLRLIGFIENMGWIESHLEGSNPQQLALFTDARDAWWGRHNISYGIVGIYAVGLISVVMAMMVLSVIFLKCGSRSLYM